MENAQVKILLSRLRNLSLFCARKQEAAQRHEQHPRLPSLLFQPRIWHKPVERHRGPRTFVSSRAAGAVRTPAAASLAPYTSRWVVVKNYIEKLTWAKGPSSPLPLKKKKSVPFRCFGAGRTVKWCWTGWRETPVSPISPLGTEAPETLTQSHGSISDQPHWCHPKDARKSGWNPRYRIWCSRNSWERWSHLSLPPAAGSTWRWDARPA